MATTSYYLYDGIGSTVALTDSSQSVTASYTYEAFGTQRGLPLASKNAYRYVGQLGYYYDEETQDYYIRARHYDSRLARFVSRDPIPLSEASTLYTYVRNSPPDYVDPTGHHETQSIKQSPCCGTEIGPVLKSLRRTFMRRFASLDIDAQIKYCQRLIGGRSLEGARSWEIVELFQSGGGVSGPFTGEEAHHARHFDDPPCGDPPCEGTVTVFGHCYWANEVNYFAFGMFYRACVPAFTVTNPWDDQKEFVESLHRGMQGWVSTWKKLYLKRTIMENSLPVDPKIKYRRPGAQTAPSMAWAEAGWSGDLKLVTAHSVDAYCSPCSKMKFPLTLSARLGPSKDENSAFGVSISEEQVKKDLLFEYLVPGS